MSKPVKKWQKPIVWAKHQGFAFLEAGLWPVCSRCIVKKQCPDYHHHATNCGFFSKRQTELIRQILRLPWIRPTDSRLVERYARLETFLDIVDLWLSRIGIFVNVANKPYEMKVQNILNVRERIEARADHQANQLILTPHARKQLGIEKRKKGFEYLDGDLGSYIEAVKLKRETAAKKKTEGTPIPVESSDHDHQEQEETVAPQPTR